MASDTDFIVSLLLEYGMVTQEQINEATEASNACDGEYDVIEMLKRFKYVDPKELTALLAQTYGMEVFDLTTYQIPAEVLAELTSDIVHKYRVVPVMMHDSILTVAISDPTDLETIDALRYYLNKNIDAVVSSSEQIDNVISRNYHTATDSVEGFMENFEEHGFDEYADMDGSTSAIGEAESLSDDNSPLVRLVTTLIIDAYKAKASDIHLEPLEKRYRVRYRIDGALREIDGPPKFMQSNFTSRIKIMARLNITEKRIPQDGRIQLKIGEKDIDLRVSSIPTTHGESIVMRILDKASIQLEIPQLGFHVNDLKLINQIINMPDGIFLVTGPTGSGKTTSLYAFINTINDVSRKIITVEDPVEYQLAGINQVQVDKHIDMTFAAALRSMLRQAPNIIMVGEIRDLETAEIAINAALTGHLVFSTLHTNDAPSAIARLTDMGIQPFLAATGIRAIMAQRLLRRICSNCKEEYTPNSEEIRLLGMTDEYLAQRQFYKGKGCHLCHGTGFKGRIGIYEIMMINEDIAKLIFANEPTSVLRDAARANGMHTLRDDGLLKAEAGVTTLAEVIFATVVDK